MTYQAVTLGPVEHVLLISDQTVLNVVLQISGQIQLFSVGDSLKGSS